MRKKLPVPVSNQTRALPLRDEIAQRAYELWEHDGRPEGRDVDHWLSAERQLLGADPQVMQTPAGAVRSPELADAMSGHQRGHPQNSLALAPNASR
ncbi:MAG: DUF2934 domain-containing protein [Opitutae bacterium]|nr:DUF2934 domain-containing protein [Opitutae bacterium]